MKEKCVYVSVCDNALHSLYVNGKILAFWLTGSCPVGDTRRELATRKKNVKKSANTERTDSSACTRGPEIDIDKR